jgi:hypothetical protein
VLLALADEFQQSDEEFVSLGRLRERIPEFGLNPIREALRGLKSRQQMTVRTEMRPDGHFGLGPQRREVELEEYRITRDGISSIRQLDSRHVARLWAQLSVDDRSLPSNGDKGRWEPLPIDRSTPQFREMEHATEIAIERIEADNGYAANESDERAAVLGSLRGAMEAIKQGWPSRTVVQASLLATLRFVAEKFAGTGIGEVAKKAFDLAWKWLASL